jgi:GNAT superfamily N-acetyltransferase
MNPGDDPPVSDPPGFAGIRRMRPGEAGEVSRVIVAAIRSGFTGSYSPEVVEAAVRGNSPQAVLARASKQVDYVLVQDGRIAAMTGLKRNEIGHLFVDPAHRGKGMGRRLVDFARRQFRAAGHRDMFTLASLNAVGFYRRCGFRAEGRGSFSPGEGLDLEYVRMRAALGEPAENGGESGQ